MDFVSRSLLITGVTILSCSFAHADGAGDANAGMAALGRHDYGGAVQFFTRAMQEGGLSAADRESAFVERATAYIGQGNNAAALADLTAAQKLNPNDGDIPGLRVKAQAAIAALPQANAPQPAAPPPAAKKGPSLTETMDFIQQSITAEGLLNYATTVHDTADGRNWTNQFAAEVSNVRANPASCRIDFHWNSVSNGNVQQDVDAWLDVKTITSVQVLPAVQLQSRVDADAGHPTWITQMNPSLSSLVAMWPGGHTEFMFRDEDTAGRVGKAMEHANELCGGKQPF